MLVAVVVVALVSLEVAQTSPEVVYSSSVAEARREAALERLAESAERMAAAAEKIAGITPAAAADVKPADAAPSSVWTGVVGFGLIWLAGNSENLTLSGNAAAELKTTDWIFSGKLTGAYGQTVIAGTAGDPEVTALNAALLLRLDRRFTERVTGYVAAGLDTDHVKSVEYRATGEAGASITWIEEKKEDFVLRSLRTDLGFRYSQESRFQYYPFRLNLDDEELVAPRAGVAFRYALSESLIFTEDAEVLPNIVGDSRVLLNSASKLSVRMTQALSLGVALGINHDTNPAEGKEKTDSSLTIGLEIAL